MSADPIERTRNAQAGACAYLLHILLQEAEQRQRGFIEAIIEGVVGDHQGIPGNVPDKPYIDAIFTEALQILERAKGPFTPPEMQPPPRPRT